MNKLEYGARQAVVNCVKLKPEEKTVIITDKITKVIADKIYKNCELISQGRTKLFIMEDFGNRPEDGSCPLKFPHEIGKEMEDADVSFYCASTKKGELQSFRTPMTKHVRTNKKLRHAHMPGITQQLMETGMNVDYQKVQELTAQIHDIVKKATSIRVTTPAGTDFTTYFNNSWKWIISDGLIRPENWSNLPDGEIFTCAKAIPKGTIVIDGVLGDYLCPKYGDIQKTPLTVKIENSRIVDTQCSNKELLKDFNEYTSLDENANRVGEFAIGTNTGLKTLVGNLLQDEKFSGIHVAFGHGYPEITGSSWNSDAHIDCVLRNCTIIVDDKPIMINGKFVI